MELAKVLRDRTPIKHKIIKHVLSEPLATLYHDEADAPGFGKACESIGEYLEIKLSRCPTVRDFLNEDQQLLCQLSRVVPESISLLLSKLEGRLEYYGKRYGIQF